MPSHHAYECPSCELAVKIVVGVSSTVIAVNWDLCKGDHGFLFWEMPGDAVGHGTQSRTLVAGFSQLPGPTVSVSQ